MNKGNAYLIYLIFSGASALFFGTIFTVNLVYQTATVGLNPLQLVLVGTVLEVSAFLFELPTGIVADVYSRRLSVIVGTALIGVGFIIEGSFPHFAAVLLSQVVWGLGATFISGAADAWIVDEIGEEKAGRAFLRASPIGQVMSLVGTGLSVALASRTIQLPIVLGGGTFLGLAVLLGLFMPEEGFTPTPPEQRRSWRQMREPLGEGVRLVRRRPVLATVLAISLVYGTFSEGVDRLWTAHILDNFALPTLGALEPVAWFGVIRGVAALLSLGTTEIARRRLDLNDQRAVRRALAALYAGVIGAVVVFALARPFGLALLAFWVSGALRATADPIFTAWANQHIDSPVRATVLSLAAQANAVGQIAGGPVLGWVGTARSLRAALALAGIMLTPTLILLGVGRPQPVAAVAD